MATKKNHSRSARRSSGASCIPVVDLFAGPGGLGEGFSSVSGADGTYFDLRLSVEKDPIAHQTLELRSFFRKFPREDVPEDYYRFLRGEIDRTALFARYGEQAELARREAWNMELGSSSLPEAELDQRIAEAS